MNENKRETCLRHGYSAKLVGFYYVSYFFFFMLIMLPLSLSFGSLVQILAKLLNPSLVATSDLGWGFSLLCVCVNGTSRHALLCVSSSESYNRPIQLV